jgi:predicted N-acetyltransferase YhbS
MPTKQQTDVVVRTATLEDVPECARICYAAFSTINAAHGFPCDFPGVEAAAGFLAMLFAAPDFYCVVAESEGRIVGSNCLDERSTISGVGPITVDPSVQSAGVGRKLMQAVMDRAEEQGAAGIRLVQAAFHCRSLALYASLGFDIREPLACLQGRTAQRGVAGCSVRPAETADLEACKALSVAVHGFDRTGELRGTSGGKVVEREGRITGYTTDLAFFGHTTAETNPDLQALIASAESFGGPGILLPSRNTAVLRWCLANGLRMVQPMTLMSKGLYNEPRGAWLASVFF